MYDVPDDFKLPNHTVLQHKDGKTDAIKLIDAPYSGIIFSYGKVSFDKIVGDDGDDYEEHVTMHFEYDVHDYAGHDFSEGQLKEFEQFLGDFLKDLIIFGLKNNNISYTGGVDENRTSDPIESDYE